MIIYVYKKFYKVKKWLNYEDGHNELETPVLIPNTEVKLFMLVAVVPDKVQNHQAVFHSFSSSFYNINF